MTSDAKNVTDYLKDVPEKRMAYGGPTYKIDKGIEIGFASQKNHICFYCLIHQVMLDNKELLKGLNHGKGCIRYQTRTKLILN